MLCDKVIILSHPIVYLSSIFNPIPDGILNLTELRPKKAARHGLNGSASQIALLLIFIY